MKKLKPLFPTPKHEEITNMLVDYYKSDPRIFAVVLFGSSARGQGVPDSSVDLAIFIYPKFIREFFNIEETSKRIAFYSKIGGETKKFWREFPGSAITQREHAIEFKDSSVIVDLIFRTDRLHRDRGPLGMATDNFEEDIGNLFVYCVPLYERDDTYKSLGKKYLPFYDNEIRKDRLDGIRKELNYRIRKVKRLAERELLFSAHQQFFFAMRIFLKYLFIKKQKYPLGMAKWVKYELTDILHEPKIYEELTRLFPVRLSGEDIKTKANLLNSLVEKYG